MADDPNQGKCIYCTWYREVNNKHVCQKTRVGGWDYVQDKEREEEVNCYAVNGDGTCIYWEAIS